VTQAHTSPPCLSSPRLPYPLSLPERPMWVNHMGGPKMLETGRAYPAETRLRSVGLAETHQTQLLLQEGPWVF
jgi:hypothetical protein